MKDELQALGDTVGTMTTVGVVAIELGIAALLLLAFEVFDLRRRVREFQEDAWKSRDELRRLERELGTARRECSYEIQRVRAERRS